MIVEGLRTDSLYIAGTQIRTSQALSAAIVAVCAVLLVVLLVKNIKNPKPIEGVDFFVKDESKATKGKKIKLNSPKAAVKTAETEKAEATDAPAEKEV